MSENREPGVVAGTDPGQRPASESHVPGESELTELLTELLENPEDWDQIVERIDKIFTQTKALMVLDMSGFSRTTLNRGITTFLLMIHQMQRLAVPSVEDNGGTLIKTEADDLYCIFDTVPDALAAGREIAVRLETANLILPKGRELYASIGIGYGPVLNIGNQDLWGSEMNHASKLGEDVADKGEIILSEAAKEALGESVHRFEQRSLDLSGIDLNYYLLLS
jgi:class 3 adenylate cyclase